MAAQVEYYEALGVPKNASDADIKKSFRRLARELHPDVNPDPGAADRFKVVAEAYEVLSDPDRRARYDRFGHAGVDGGVHASATWASSGIGDLFSMLFGDDPFSRGQESGEDALFAVEISLKEASTGVERTVTLALDIACERCDASGAEPGTHPSTCPQCSGHGQVQQIVRTMLGQMARVHPCPACHGSGRIIAVPCSTCGGRGAYRGEHEVTIPIPAGIDNGQRLRLGGRGHAGENGAPAGDLYVQVTVTPQPGLVRDGLDLVTETTVTITAATLGTTVTIPTLDGDQEVELTAGTQPGEIVTLRGRGMPELRSGRRGNLRVHVRVLVPSHLTEDQRRLVEELDSTLHVGHEKKHGIRGRLRRHRGS